MAVGAKVRIYGDWDGSGVKKAEKDLNAFSQQVSGFTGSMSKSFLGVGAAIGGAFAITSVVSGFTNFLRESTQAAMEDEKSLVSLAVAMNNLGLATENAGVEDFVLQLSLATGQADDQLRPAMQRLLTVTGDVAKSQDALRLAMDIAAGTGRDLDSVVLALSRGFGGNTTALSRLGAGLDQATLKSKDMDLITAALADKFGGQASAAAETFQGKMNRLNVAVGEAQETIGYELLIALDNASTALGGVGGFSDMVTKAADKLANVIAGVSVFTTTLSRFRLELARQGTPADAFITALGDIIVRLDRLVNPVQRVIGILSDLGEENRKARGALSATTQAAIAAGGAMGQTLTPETYDAADAADKASKSYLDLWEAIWKTRSAAADLANTSGTVTSALAAGAATGGVPEYWKRVSEAYGETEKAARSAGSAAKESAKGFGELRKELLASLEDSPAERYAGIIDQLKGNLKSAEETFTRFKDSVISSITQAFSFGDAYQAAKESGITFLDALQQQAGRAVMFAEVIKQLVIDGLKPEALQQVLAAGVEAGTKIGIDLINGGATAIAQTNALVDQSIAAANEVAELAASSYFGAGVKNAQDTLDGFAAQLGPDGPSNKRMQRIMDSLAASLNRTSYIDVITRYSTQGSPPSVGGARVYGADGGIVNRPTLALIGEAGPEAVVPLHRVPGNEPLPMLRGNGGGTNITVNVNAGMGTDGAEVGRQIVDALRQYQRRNGPIPVTTTNA